MPELEQVNYDTYKKEQNKDLLFVMCDNCNHCMNVRNLKKVWRGFCKKCKRVLIADYELTTTAIIINWEDLKFYLKNKNRRSEEQG